jgi:hypothetical protein
MKNLYVNNLKDNLRKQISFIIKKFEGIYA